MKFIRWRVIEELNQLSEYLEYEMIIEIGVLPPTSEYFYVDTLKMKDAYLIPRFVILISIYTIE